MKEAIAKLKEAENLLKTEAFMECCAAERCEECVTEALAILQQPKAQPSSEFTKKARKTVDKILSEQVTSDLSATYISAILLEACDRLDESKASRKELLDACKELIENEPHGITPYFDKALRRIEAAISNAGG